MPLYPGFPLAGSDYTVGTITLTAGSKDFTLTGSNPLDYAAAQAGDEIYVPHAAKILLIETINNSGGTLIYPCPQDCAGNDLPFRLQLKNSSSRLQGMAAMLLQAIGSGNLAGLDELSVSDGQLLAADSVAGKFKGVNPTDLQTTLPALLTNIAALNLQENQLIAGDANSGQVKAIDLPPPVDISGKLDKIGGNITGDLTIEGNITAPNIYTKTQADGKYIDKAGGTITGILTVDGALITAENIQIGTAILQNNGDIKGSIWQQWGSDWAFSAIDARIHQIVNQAIASISFIAAQGDNWIEYADGTIVQWDKGVYIENQKDITFPRAFPNSCRHVSANYGISFVKGVVIHVFNFTNIGFTAQCRWDGGVGATDNALWMAWGN